ncbi:Ig-like domain-containing protein, partial [Aeromonas sp. JL9]|uniref:Ig-like domain-containing protein n=1 Tax=Aeromonas sp. JL9 TaxID=2950549 RepID=UPI00210C3B39
AQAIDGLVTGNSEGAAQLTARFGGMTSNAVAVTVTGATISAIDVTPGSVSLAKGVREPLSAVARFSDGTALDISGSVSWVSDDAAVARMLGNVVEGVSAGTTSVVAKYRNGPVVSNVVAVTVSSAELTRVVASPASLTLPKGVTQAVTVEAQYTDGSTFDVTRFASWSSSDAAVAQAIDGLVTGNSEGAAQLTARFGGMTSNAVVVTVTAAIISDIRVIPVSVTMGVGQTLQLSAMAIFSDGSEIDVSGSVIWYSDDDNVAAVGSGGLLTALASGATYVSASKDAITSNIVLVDAFESFLDLKAGTTYYSVDQGFPSTGFVGAKFKLRVRNGAGADEYDWYSSAEWVQVSAEGVVSFVSQGDSNPVTIIAEPKGQGVRFAYTFRVAKWFLGNEGDYVTWAEAEDWCSTQGLKQASREELTRGEDVTGMGSLISEWSTAMSGAASIGVGGGTWTREAFDDSSHYYVVISRGDIGIEADSWTHFAVCVNEL